jgi:hypothetical protein
MPKEMSATQDVAAPVDPMATLIPPTVYARMDGNGNVIDLVTLIHTPVDVPHKNVYFKLFVTDPQPAFDYLTQDIVAADGFDKDGNLRRTWNIVDKDPESLREMAAEKTRRVFRQQIIDALPNMKAVTALVAARDAQLQIVATSMDAKAITMYGGLPEAKTDA